MSQFCTCTGSCRKKAGSKLGEGWVCVLDILPERRKADNWHIIQSAPRGVSIQLFCPDQKGIRRGQKLPTVEGTSIVDGFECDITDEELSPTHWQPLPPPPAVSEPPSRKQQHEARREYIRTHWESVTRMRLKEVARAMRKAGLYSSKTSLVDTLHGLEAMMSEENQRRAEPPKDL